MIKSLSDHAVFSWIYKTFKSFLAVDTYDLLVATQNRIFLERLIKEFDNMFYYNSQEGAKLKLLNITIILSEHAISIGQTNHIINEIIHEFWGTKKNRKLSIRSHLFR